MAVGITEHLANRRQSLEIMRNVEFPRYPHAAVNLHRLLTNQSACGADLVLDRVYGARGFIPAVEKGVREGAKLLVGGGRPSHLEKGFFVEPTLFVDVDPDSTIAQEEIFGPVLAVIPFDDDDDAVRIANNSSYGLSGAVSSASLDRAMAVARRVRTGTLGVNGGMWFGPDSPFGGYKQSGIGREHGVEGFEEYLQVKTIGTPAA